MELRAYRDMKRTLLTGLLTLASSSALAMDAAELLSGLTWEKRVLLVFAPDDRDVEYQRQGEILETVEDGLLERHMTVIRVLADSRLSVDDRAREASVASFYRRFDVGRDAFRVILVGKDGTLKLDRDDAVTSDALFALIDAMPMRRSEMLQQE